MSTGYIDMPERSLVDRPQSGLGRFQKTQNVLTLVNPDGSATVVGAHGWPTTQLVRAAIAMNVQPLNWDWSPFGQTNDAAVGGANPPTLVTTEDGGVYQFTGAGTGSINFPGSFKIVANPTTSRFYVSSRIKLVDVPTAASDQYYVILLDFANNYIAIRLNGASSTTAPTIELNKAGVVTNSPPFSIAVGAGITVGNYCDIALAGNGSAITAYVDGIAAATVGMAGVPVVALVPELLSVGAPRMNADSWLWATA